MEEVYLQDLSNQPHLRQRQQLNCNLQDEGGGDEDDDEQVKRQTFCNRFLLWLRNPFRRVLPSADISLPQIHPKAEKKTEELRVEEEEKEKRKKTTRLVRTLLSKFLPKRWTNSSIDDPTEEEIESPADFFLVYLENRYQETVKMWNSNKKTFYFSLSCTLFSMAFFFYLFGPRARIGTVLEPEITTSSDNWNLVFKSPRLLDLLNHNDEELDFWFGDQISNSRDDTMIGGGGGGDFMNYSSGYFTSSIYQEGDFNISFSNLHNLLRYACSSNSGCLCASSMHLGIPRNIIFLNTEEALGGGTNQAEEGNLPRDLLLINPEVRYRSAETFEAKYNSEITVNRPQSVRVEYTTKEGIKSKRQFFLQESACLMQCIEIYEKYKT